MYWKEILCTCLCSFQRRYGSQERRSHHWWDRFPEMLCQMLYLNFSHFLAGVPLIHWIYWFTGFLIHWIYKYLAMCAQVPWSALPSKVKIWAKTCPLSNHVYLVQQSSSSPQRPGSPPRYPNSDKQLLVPHTWQVCPQCIKRKEQLKVGQRDIALYALLGAVTGLLKTGPSLHPSRLIFNTLL